MRIAREVEVNTGVADAFARRVVVAVDKRVGVFVAVAARLLVIADVDDPPIRNKQGIMNKVNQRIQRKELRVCIASLRVDVFLGMLRTLIPIANFMTEKKS